MAQDQWNFSFLVVTWVKISRKFTLGQGREVNCHKAMLSSRAACRMQGSIWLPSDIRFPLTLPSHIEMAEIVGTHDDHARSERTATEYEKGNGPTGRRKTYKRDAMVTTFPSSAI